MIYNKLNALGHRKYHILAVGELLVDEIRDDNNTLFLTFGGSPANIAVNTTQLGLNVNLIAAIGNDMRAKFLLGTLADYAVPVTHIQKNNTATTLVRLVESKTNPVPKFVRSSDYLIKYTDSMIDLVKGSKILHFSYWPLTKEPAKSTILKLVKLAKKENLIIAFDPNIHEQLKTDETIDEAMLWDLLKDVDIIKPSYDDAARLFGYGLTKEAYMQRFEALGIPLIIMTLDEKGVYVSESGKRYYYPSNTVDVVDATGAGDAFWAGFYAGLAKGMDLTSSIHIAQRISGIILNAVGAIAPLPALDVMKGEGR